MTQIIHDGALKTLIPAHVKADGTKVAHHWRVIGAGDTYSGDPNVMSTDNAGAWAPPTNPNERDTLPGGRAS